MLNQSQCFNLYFHQGLGDKHCLGWKTLFAHFHTSQGILMKLFCHHSLCYLCLLYLFVTPGNTPGKKQTKKFKFQYL